MSELNRSNEQRPEGWSLEQEGYERVERKDYFGNPYTAWDRKQKPDIGKLWDQFRIMSHEEDQKQRSSYVIVQQDTDLHDESQELSNREWNEKIELHETIKMMENG